MPFLHLPVQSGSDRVLAAMNRRHVAADYLRLVERLRAARPTWRSRPTSSSATPARPRPTFRRRWPSCARSASPRRSASNTRRAPAHLPPARHAQLPEREKDRAAGGTPGPAARPADRVQRRLRRARLCRCCSPAPGRHSGQIAGRSPFLQPVHVTGPSDLIGKEISVQIAAALPNSLSGTLTEERACA